ncbi:glycogen debranching protein GlgX [Pauljensenia sp. 20925_1_27]
MSERSGSPCVPTVRVTEPNPVPSRLGVFRSGDGLDVSVVARGASGVDMCIFDEAGAETRFALIGPHTGIWHGHIPGFGAGTRYGFRVHGPWDPDGGKFYNSHKLLLDPYGRGVDGVVDMKPGVYAHCVDEDLYPSEYPLRRSPIDSAAYMPRSVVVEPSFPIEPQPHTPWETTVIYEMHVKGFTKNMPGVPPQLRGTYAGLAHPASVSYLKDLGVTAVELLPVHAKCDEPFLTERGLTNYWGYSTLSFFAPEPSYATEASRERGAQAVVDEFRGMVSLLHQAGIEVILDVVYNHTCEGGDAGPSLSWRGLDSDLYYRHTTSRPVQAIDVTGTGNTVNMDHPKTIQMVLDSLRYWVREMGVDGFRFDLAATLGRFATGFSPMHPLLIAMATDDLLAHVKLIAEPWDVGPGGWQTGNFPVPFSEWNDHYRGALRNFWLADVRAQASGHVVTGPNDLATRLSGSQDVFEHGLGRLRGPRASINFVTAHDGFTLADLTAYDRKHNTANLENNRDGSDDNRSWNHSVEGTLAVNATHPNATTPYAILSDMTIADLRARSQRNILTTMFVSSGTPMLTGGDEFGRTQYGNNNAYCQDDPISWVDWDLAEGQLEQIDTVSWLIALRQAHPVLRPDRFATGTPHGGDTIPDLSWYTAQGTPMPDYGWTDARHRTFQMLRSGVTWGDRDALIIINANLDGAEVTLPEGHDLDWLVAYSTVWATPSEGGVNETRNPGELSLDAEHVAPRSTLSIEPLSVTILLSDVAFRPEH